LTLTRQFIAGKDINPESIRPVGTVDIPITISKSNKN